ncbi:PliI family lysozyme inhibitor of I-type lysozyme [Maribellus sediminis]|uniref:PliI family lysozyme inhibitor of I-type lysozyme n=1 Tax=Maribellus sediminis TaxID=2696285 RepID=UPI001431AC68|nr:PliI family lysozyme inhibitor of I-type lysozyme [Maribellus sediminis]
MKTWLWISLLLFTLTSCTNSGKEKAKTAPTEGSSVEAKLYVSTDGMYKLSVKPLGNDQLEVNDLNTGKSHRLNQTEAASGAKYSNDEAYVFWSKGPEFMWMKGDEMLASGQQKTNTLVGNYVNADYFQRDKGYDWVGIKVSNAADDQLLVQVRSRADRKKPTCTWDARIYPESTTTYYTVENDTKVHFAFTNDTLSIAAEDEKVLYFFCSGGATIAGNYIKIDEPLDPEQVDSTVFSKVLQLQGIGFYVTSVRKGPQTAVSVSPFGLEKSNRVETYTVDGYVTDAEIEDLNADGSPELLVYIQSFGSGSYGSVLAFSVNNRKSLSQAYLPPINQDPALSEGYMGHDEFRVVENYLVQRFPIYKEGDSNANPTGGVRQITYTLEEGEAMRQFKVKDIRTFNR